MKTTIASILTISTIVTGVNLTISHDRQDDDRQGKNLANEGRSQPQTIQFAQNRWFNASGSIFLNVDSDDDDDDIQSLQIVKNTDTDIGGETLVYVGEDGNVGIGTTAPEHRLHVAGDVRIEGRTALGNAAHVGLGGGLFPEFDRIHDFSHVITDFSSSSLWAPVLCSTVLDPIDSLISSEIYCNSFEAHVAEGNSNDVLLLTGLTGGTVHSGDGRIVNLIGELVFSESRSTGEISYNTGLGVVAGGHFESAGEVVNNIGVSINTGHSGVAGRVQNDTGLFVYSPRTTQPIDNHYGIYLEDQNGAQIASYAIYSAGGDVFFDGDLEVTGTLSKGSGSFRIDHPLDPTNKYLSHSFVESPDMMNIYNGITETDRDGYATITMPDWFEALNRDHRYQLTVIDGVDSELFALAKVVREMHEGQFTIRTNKPHVTVSWQVTGIRQDAFANANRIPVESDKPASECGSYLHPEAFGQPASAKVKQMRNPKAD